MAISEKTNIELYPYRRGVKVPPNPTQCRILNWVDAIRSGVKKFAGIPTLYLQGGVGCGKTRGLLAPVLEMLLQIPHLRVLWARQDYNDLRLSAMETFFEVLPPELLSGQNVQEHRYMLKQLGGGSSQIFFRDLKDVQGLGSQEFGVVVVTEVHEITQQAFRFLKLRLRQAGMPTMMLIEGNPPNEGHWLDNLTKPDTDEYDSDVEKWEVSTYENWENLPDGYRNSLEAMPPSWKAKYLFGRTGFLADGKPFYTGFREDLHKRELSHITGKTVYRSIDFGYHHPACLWIQLDAKDRLMVLGELMGSDITLERFIPVFTHFENTHFPGVDFKTFYDQAGNQKTDKADKTCVEILANFGITGLCADSNYVERKELIERKLSTLIDGIPSLVVNRSCPIIIDGFLGGYHYPKTKENQAQKEEPEHDDYYSHLMNCLEYVIVNLYRVREEKSKPIHYGPLDPMAA